MGEHQKKKKLKVIIIILLILLVLGLLSICIVMILGNMKKESSNIVILPDNIIAQEKDNLTDGENNVNSPTSIGSGISNQELYKPLITNKEVVGITLNNKNTYDNMPFQVSNMFPGDKETRYFGVKVSYQGSVKVNFSTNIDPGYEKLSEVLKCKVVLLSEGKRILYDGLMRDMPKSLNYTLTSIGNVTDEVYYGITVYLDTSVNSEYMNKNLKANFHWWIEEKSNLGSGKK